jgi:spore maturation protein CgeB
MRKLFERTKLVLQVTPKITSGSHERAFEALLHGALPISTPNRFLKEEFPEVPQYHSPEELVYWAERLLANEDERRERVEASRPRLLSHHTWDNRVKTLLSHF